MKTTRVQERYYHYQRCVIKLKKAVDRDLHDFIVLAAIVKSYEMSFDLGLKVIRDFMEYKGTDTLLRDARDVIRAAFKAYVYIDAPLWLQMLAERNEIIHVYDDDCFLLLANRIKERYLDEFEHTATIMKELLDKLE